MRKPERIARELALELASHPDVLAVAATGSLARGDVSPGSDLDLWVLGPEDGKEDFVIDNLEVTLLYTSLDYARSADCAARFETGQALSLHDPSGALAEVIAAVDDDEVRAELERGTSALLTELTAELTAGRAAAPREELALLRELAQRAACWFVLNARGWRVPKQRHLEDALFPLDHARLMRISRADAVDVTRLPAAISAARSPSPRWPLPSRAQVERYLRAGRIFDAVVGVRQALPPLPGTSLAKLDDATRDLFDLVHPPARGDERAELRALLERCGVKRLAGGRQLARVLS